MDLIVWRHAEAEDERLVASLVDALCDEIARAAA